MTDFRRSWNQFVAKFAETVLPDVPERTAVHLGFQPTAAGYESYCQAEIKKRENLECTAYDAPELLIAKKNDILANLQCDVTHIANVEMGNALSGLVESKAMEHEAALEFARSEGMQCLNTLLPAGHQME